MIKAVFDATNFRKRLHPTDNPFVLMDLTFHKTLTWRAGISSSKLQAAVEAAAMPVAVRTALEQLATVGRIRIQENTEARATPPFYTGPTTPSQVTNPHAVCVFRPGE